MESLLAQPSVTCKALCNSQLWPSVQKRRTLMHASTQQQQQRRLGCSPLLPTIRHEVETRNAQSDGVASCTYVQFLKLNSMHRCASHAEMMIVQGRTASYGDGKLSRMAWGLCSEHRISTPHNSNMNTTAKSIYL